MTYFGIDNRTIKHMKAKRLFWQHSVSNDCPYGIILSQCLCTYWLSVMLRHGYMTAALAISQALASSSISLNAA